MGFEPEELAPDASPAIAVAAEDSAEDFAGPWRTIYRHPCAFGPDVFAGVMANLIKNPNINSTWLFRADILHDDSSGPPLPPPGPPGPGAPRRAPVFAGFELRRHMVRRLIPRNTLRDKPLDQTCLIYENTPPIHGEDAGHEAWPAERSLVVYLPHLTSPADVPFYHPAVRGIAFLHEWLAAESCGFISVSYLYFDHHGSDAEEKNPQDDPVAATRLMRTALHLLEVVYKHGTGRLAGYQKRVHHDQLVPQARLQTTYARLKTQYARALIESWVETTNPDKHVFEDLCIAAFLIELWADMYGADGGSRFPGFVDIGCGNGLLVYILNQEGFPGWGFDARARKSWANYNTQVRVPGDEIEQDSVRELVLLPPPVLESQDDGTITSSLPRDRIHDGRFPKGTFIISNHADELTPWTPILAALSECPFIAIPCCSHNLAGARFRAPAPPRDKHAAKDKSGKKGKADSAYASLVAWVGDIARDCGWEVEHEMLRIPSTRNAALLGRKRSADTVDISAVVARYGGAEGYLASAANLVASVPRDEEH
jgi:tRNASer (uridine44-2'-O)-methyltransferase